jgi:multidrug efflux pump subunit AcrA (membrane-fusion protein)
VLNSGKGQTVFVALGEGRFEPRTVQTGLSDDQGYVQVLSGLQEGETIVTSAQFMLDSESKLREAVQKMLEIQDAPDAATGHEGHSMPQDNEDLFK